MKVEYTAFLERLENFLSKMAKGGTYTDHQIVAVLARKLNCKIQITVFAGMHEYEHRITGILQDPKKPVGSWRVIWH